MPAVAPGKGYRTFAITGQKVQLSSGSVPNLSSIFYNDYNTTTTTTTTSTMVQQKNRANHNGSFYQTPDDIRKAVQKYMSASASDITRLNDTQVTNMSLHRTSNSKNGEFSSRDSSRVGSPAPNSRQHLEVSIRVSTPDESNGKMPPTGRGRPHSPNISMIRGPKFSVFYFNDDFTFDEDSSQAQLAENMLNDLTISSTLEQTSEMSQYNDSDDKTPMNSSNSDGGYVSSELSDNTIHDSPKIDVKRIQEAQRDISDQNNNTKTETNQQQENHQVGRNEVKPQVQTSDSFGVDLYLTQRDLVSNSQQDSEINGRQYDNVQRTVSKMSDDVFTESSADETMRFSELKLSEASSMASTLHNDDLESNISYDIRINDTMGVPMVSTLKRQDGHSKETDLSVLNDNTITLDDGLLQPVAVNKEMSEQSPRKPDIPENQNWKQERSSSFSGFTQLERLKGNSNRSYRDLNRIRGEHSYVRRNDSFVKSIENVSPWKGSWTARNVTFDETANKKFRIASRQEEREQQLLQQQQQQQYQQQQQREENDQKFQYSRSQNNIHYHHVQQIYKQTRPQNHYGSLDVRRHNRNQHQKPLPQHEMRTGTMPQQSNLARHLHNTSAPSGKVSNEAWKRYSSPTSLEPHFTAYNQEERDANVTQVSRQSNHGGRAPRSPTRRSQNQNAANHPSRSDLQSGHNYVQAVPKDYKYPTLPRNFGAQKSHQQQQYIQKNVQHKDFIAEQQRNAQLKELVDPRLAQGAQNLNKKVVRQYYAQFYDQNHNKPPSPERRNITQRYTSGHPEQHPSQTQGRLQNYGPGNQSTQLVTHPVHRNISHSSYRSNSFSSYSNSTSSSRVRNGGSPNFSYCTSFVPVPENSIYTQNNSKNKSARRKLQLSDSSDEDDGGFKHQHKRQEKKEGQTVKGTSEGETEEESVPRHPAIQPIQEAHRWVGSGYQDEPVRLSADRGYLLWHHPKGTLDVMIYYGYTGEDFSCFIEHQLPGVDVFYVHPTGRKELLLDGTRSDHDSPDSKRAKSHWSHNFNRNKEIRSWGGQIVLRLEPLKYFPCQSFKMPYFLAL